jgi:hypothetical protein
MFTRMNTSPRSAWGVVVVVAGWLAAGLLAPPATAGPAARDAAEAKLPLKVSEDRRRLVDASGRPFLYHADTAWHLFTRLTADEAAEYLAARRRQRFNVVQVHLTGFLNHRDRAGRLPFGEQHDFAAPDEGYFAHVDGVLAEARRLGLVVAIAPLWHGCCGEGWAGRDGKTKQPKPMAANGPEKCRALGEWLGRRYAKLDHVLWILGGDNDPGADRDNWRQIGLGLKAAAPTQLVTYHAASSHSSTDVWPADEAWLDVSMTYTYFRGFNKAWNKNQPDVYEVNHKEYPKTPIRPFFLGESTYEGEHGDWGSATQARKQAYWSVLSGATGHAYGSPAWAFNKDWRKALELPGAASLAHLRGLLESRPWALLVPDAKGERVADPKNGFGKNDHTVTAVASDQSFLIAYLPGERTIHVDLGRLGGERVRAWWFDPRDGSAKEIGTFDRAAGRTAFAPPGPGDWALVLDDAAKGYAPPGTVRTAQ